MHNCTNFIEIIIICTLSYKTHHCMGSISVQAKNDDAAGNQTGAKQKAYIALALNIAAVLFHVVVAIAIITPIAVTVSAAVKPTISTISPTPGWHQYYCRYCSYPFCTYSNSYSSYSYTTSYSTYYCYLLNNL